MWWVVGGVGWGVVGSGRGRGCVVEPGLCGNLNISIV